MIQIQVASCPTIVAAANESNQTNNISGLQQICLPWMTLQMVKVAAQWLKTHSSTRVLIRVKCSGYGQKC